MTPAIQLLKNNNIPYTLHKYKHDRHNSDYGQEAIDCLPTPAQTIFKTLVVELSSQQLAVAVIPVKEQLNLKRLAQHFKVKSASLAAPAKATNSSGYLVGGISPLGQKKQLPTAIDQTAASLNTLFVSAGKRGLEIELKPADLASLSEAEFEQLT